ncbi:hypothetical protein [Ascidiaceihabitans sp.]|uniref:hypothetical protein n=1 Tax=Ascidiaceihabitans sp. TaxID=1872644 RepID=UPI00329898B6
MGRLIVWIGCIAAGIGLYFWIAEGVERQNVRDCLEQSSRQYGIGNQHHVYLTDVIQVEVHRSYGDGTATRFAKYQLQGSSEIQSTTCRW